MIGWAELEHLHILKSRAFLGTLLSKELCRAKASRSASLAAPSTHREGRSQNPPPRKAKPCKVFRCLAPRFWEQYEMAMPLWLPTADLWSKIHAIGEFRYSVISAQLSFGFRWSRQVPIETGGQETQALSGQLTIPWCSLSTLQEPEDATSICSRGDLCKCGPLLRRACSALLRDLLTRFSRERVRAGPTACFDNFAQNCPCVHTAEPGRGIESLKIIDATWP